MNGRIDIGRREFIGGIGAFAAASLTGCATDKGAVAVRAKDGDYRAILLHLGYNMWCDAPTEYATELGMEKLTKKRQAKTRLICSDDIWRRAVDHAAARGMNMIFIDLGEGVAYPSHPELAVEGTWSADKLVRELDRIRALGMEPVPKINFSCQHNGWMKDWRFMVSSRPYHRFCEDLIRDVADIFGHPRFMHIGCDEETSSMQRQRLYACVRRGEIWKQDFLHLVRTSEACGMRPWAWADYGWDNPEFYSWCPKSVVMQNWYYDEAHAGFDPKVNPEQAHINRLLGFWKLEEAGFDQVPCGTNWVGYQRIRDKAGADDVIGELVKTCRAVVAPTRLKGFMMAPWDPCETEENLAFINRGTDLFADALEGRICR